MKIYRKLFEILLVGLAVLGFSGSFAFAQAPQGGSNGNIVRVDQGQMGPGFAQHPLYLKVLGRDSHGAPIFASSAKPATALGAAAISSYLNLSNDGAGQTIAIVDAYDHPNIESDLNYFSSDQNLPMICSSSQDPSTSNCFNFSKIYAQGSQPKTDAGWALEIALDVEWAHAVAPKANIVLIEAASNSLQNLFDAINVAAGVSGVAVISNSWGSGEFSSETTYDASCATVLCVFSSGDSGNPGGYPAYNPYVIAVGGTTLTLASDGTPTSEIAWSGSGGGVSQYEAKPAFQDGVNNPYNNRGMPDVSYDADPNTGFQVYDSVRYHGFSGWFQVGGTSAGAPQWAAIIAAADQTRSAPLSPVDFDASYTLYGSGITATLYDISSGSNGNCGSICQAGIGYDFVTGLGSPRSGIDLALAGDATGQGTTSPTGSGGTSSSTTDVTVPSIDYSASGAHNKDLSISVSVVVLNSSPTEPVPNASVSIKVYLNGSPYGTAAGTTNTNGVASFIARNAPAGTYTTTITDVSGSDLTWDDTTPPNSYTK